MSVPTISLEVPCPECKKAGWAHLVDCWVEERVLVELDLDDVSDLPLATLYQHFDRGDGVHIEQVCGACGSDYTRDEDGNIID